MTIAQIGQVMTVVVPLMAGGGYVGKLVGDQHWVSAETYLSNELKKVQSDKALLEWEEQNGGLTPRQQFELKQLENLEKQYEQQLD